MRVLFSLGLRVGNEKSCVRYCFCRGGFRLWLAVVVVVNVAGVGVGVGVSVGVGRFLCVSQHSIETG